jgi:hypothetical protein
MFPVVRKYGVLRLYVIYLHSYTTVNIFYINLYFITKNKKQECREPENAWESLLQTITKLALLKVPLRTRYS